MTNFPPTPRGYDKTVVHQDENTQVSILKKKKIDWVGIVIVLFFLWLIGREFSCAVAIKQQDGSYKNVIGTVDSIVIKK